MTSSMASITSSSSATTQVDKATSEFLIGPDWTMNMDICDTIINNQLLAKDVVKAMKKRLQHKNPKVQLLALTLLETIVKNCGDYVHFQIAERNILQEMVKIVKKKSDMHVRDKILVLIDIWQEAFGGPGGRYPQYFMAYEDLRRLGVAFPPRSADAAAMITPSVTHPSFGYHQPVHQMPGSSTRLDETMAAEMEKLSLSSLNSMREVLNLLADMLEAVDLSDVLAVKDEVIVDLVERCRANQKQLMQTLGTAGDEELLGQGLELNDNLQSVLAKHDALASGSPLPPQVTNANRHSVEAQDSGPRNSEVSIEREEPDANSAAARPVNRGLIEEEEDDFALLARRHSKTSSEASQSTSIRVGDNPQNVSHDVTPPDASSTPMMSNALVPINQPATKEQDIIDLLSNALVPASMSTEQTSQTPPSVPNISAHPIASTTQEISSSEADNGNQGPVFNSYVAPWAQNQPRPELQHQPQIRPQPPTELQHQLQVQPQPQPQPSSQSFPQTALLHAQPQSQAQVLHRPQPQYNQYSADYPPPPWAATPGYYSNPNLVSRPSYSLSTPRAIASSTPLQGVGPSQNHADSLTGQGSYVSINGNSQVTPNPRSTAPAAGQKPFIPSYRLFEDLNVLGNSDIRSSAANNRSSGMPGGNSQSMIGGRK